MSLETLELVKRDDFASDQDTLDLLGYTDGFNLAMKGWNPGIDDDESETTPEAFQILIQATDDDDLASIFQGLKEKRKEAKRYFSGVDKYGIWIRAQLKNETYARQALTRRLAYNWNQSPIQPNRLNLPGFTLGLDRFPWEDTTNTPFSGSSVNLIGGTFSFSSNVGDMPARLARVMFKGVNGGGGPLYRFWMGFRSGRFGTAANFKTYWPLRLATSYDTDTTGGTTNVDATAKDGYKTITTFTSDNSMKWRAYCLVNDMTANPNDQRGRFLVLLRAKKTYAGDTVRARLISGYYGGSATPRRFGRVEIESTSWQFYEMGTVTLPPAGLLGGSELMINAMLGIEAESLGTPGGDLEMDCFVLIPTEEGHVYAEAPGGVVQYDSGYEKPLVVYTRPNGKTEAWWFQAATSPAATATPQVGRGLPVGSGIAVVAGERFGSTVKADVIDISVDVYQRWESLRGAET